MEANFWHERWETNEIGFHQEKANALMVANFDRMALRDGARVFVPLCGKTLDIAWLLTRGYRVCGAELSEIAIQQLFEGLGTPPEVTQVGPLKRYSATAIDIYVGDIFDLDAGTLGQVDGVYDRAALVALPGEMRERYAAHLMTITNYAPQFLLCFEYDQSVMPGPPFSIAPEVVLDLYAANYEVAPVASAPFAGKLKGIADAMEVAWHVT